MEIVTKICTMVIFQMLCTKIELTETDIVVVNQYQINLLLATYATYT